MKLRDKIAPLIKGEVADDATTLRQYSRDTSIFERKPEVVVFPKNADDVSAIVRFVESEKQAGKDISLAARSAGTDMTGGPLTHHVSVVFTKFMNAISSDKAAMTVTAQPGAYYRDVEKQTLAKTGGLLASYPASRELCAIGGIVSNNSGGELTLRYGKTNTFVRSLRVVLADGTQTTLAPLSPDALAAKEQEDTFEGSLYKKTHALLDAHRDLIQAARPTVSKNSAGYALWNVEKDDGTFDLTQLVCGSQGTLAIVTEATLALTKPSPHHAMLVVFLSDYDILPEVVKRVLAEKPESFESYDNKTFSLAMKFMPQMLKQLGFFSALRLGLSFMPEMWMALTGGVPKLILMAEFAEDTPHAALEKVRTTRNSLQGLAVKTKIARNKAQAQKYWKVRREAFALLRKRMKGLYAAPIMDDFAVHPKDYPTFLPELYALLGEYSFTYAVTGHIGDGNFHIFPLVNLNDPKVHTMILELMPRIYALVQKYGGSITGEHNDGIVRTPYLSYQFTPQMLDLFAQVKHIFDPHDILNPGKKVGGTTEDIKDDMIRKL